MTCTETQRNLAAYVNGQLPSGMESRLMAHVEGCAGCRTQLTALRRSAERIKGFLRHEAASVAPSPAAWNSINARWQKERPVRRHGRADQPGAVARASAAPPATGARFRLALVVTVLGLFLTGVLVARNQLGSDGRGHSGGIATQVPVPPSAMPTDALAAPTAGEVQATHQAPAATETPPAMSTSTPTAPPTASPTPAPSVEDAVRFGISRSGMKLEVIPTILQTRQVGDDVIVFYSFEELNQSGQVRTYGMTLIVATHGGWVQGKMAGAAEASGPGYEHTYASLEVEMPGANFIYALAGLVGDDRISQVAVSLTDGSQDVIPITDQMYLRVWANKSVDDLRLRDANGRDITDPTPAPVITPTQAPSPSPDASDPKAAWPSVQQALEAALTRSDGQVLGQPTILRTQEIASGAVILYRYKVLLDGTLNDFDSLSYVELTPQGWICRGISGGGSPEGGTPSPYSFTAITYQPPGEPEQHALAGIISDERIRTIEVTFSDNTVLRVGVKDGPYMVVGRPLGVKETKALNANGEVFLEHELGLWEPAPSVQKAIEKAVLRGEGTIVKQPVIIQQHEVPQGVIVQYRYQVEGADKKPIELLVIAYVEAREGGWYSHGGEGGGGPAGEPDPPYTFGQARYTRPGNAQRWAIGGTVKDYRIRQFEITFTDGRRQLVPVLDDKYMLVEQTVGPATLRPLDAQGQPVPGVEGIG